MKILTKQQEQMHKTIWDHLQNTLLGVSMAFLAVTGRSAIDGHGFWPVFVLAVALAALAGAIYSFIVFLKCYQYYRAIRDVKDDSEAEVLINCRKVRFISRGTLTREQVLVCIFFIDGEERKYCYILDRPLRDEKIIRDAIRKGFTGVNIGAKCYGSTRVIKELADESQILGFYVSNYRSRY